MFFPLHIKFFCAPAMRRAEALPRRAAYVLKLQGRHMVMREELPGGAFIGYSSVKNAKPRQI